MLLIDMRERSYVLAGVIVDIHPMIRRILEDLFVNC